MGNLSVVAAVGSGDEITGSDEIDGGSKAYAMVFAVVVIFFGVVLIFFFFVLL
jgi:hypothetical protein